MKKRLFIAIDPPDDFKDAIEKELERIRYEFTNDVRFLDRENWHITITFLGDQDDAALIPILESLREACADFSSQSLNFSKMEYGPRGDSARMIWLVGTPETSKNLAALKTSLENALADRGVIFKREFRSFAVHITLARFLAAPASQLPDITKKIDFSFIAARASLMESRLQRSGSHYQLLQQENFTL
ncbi:MAG: 2'-5' RNA ligase [Candidatus Harrisonbacteria bacterium RIFCSPLOWO2_02_FULL_45_10c]|uniref:RNA 2',3'-cyclic phosphodiesterase n=1 Tax=Candidatus Harrisonbacteria bacterium RIFCSPLOWO2_02_FULL_45_10c TaxID=1798410 RepID=A0A1G1ZRW4_9BACT|nr:MAG: 2'-5' RNA ligase [Candidatus Harrisonbacteria bacterium RIFCSPLOWO2_02_FULL_45_10c]